MFRCWETDGFIPAAKEGNVSNYLVIFPLCHSASVSGSLHYVSVYVCFYFKESHAYGSLAKQIIMRYKLWPTTQFSDYFLKD
jgi:hypothetical protein